MEPNCRTSKPPHKGRSVGVNFTDCEKPKIRRFFITQGLMCYFYWIFLSHSLSSNVILRRISKIYRASFTWGRHGKWNYEVTHRPKKPTSLFQTALIIPCFSKNPSSGDFFSADHRGCVRPINSNEKPQLIKGEREMLRFRVTVKGCFFAGLPPLASFHGKLEERGWVLASWEGIQKWSAFPAVSYRQRNGTSRSKG